MLEGWRGAGVAGSLDSQGDAGTGIANSCSDVVDINALLNAASKTTTNKQTNQQTNKPTNQQTNKPTNQQTNNPTTNNQQQPTTTTTNNNQQPTTNQQHSVAILAQVRGILPNTQFLRAWVSVLATFGASEKVQSISQVSLS